MVCHGELARDRPPSRYLTEFYLWLAVGGVLGGVLNALIAPQLFDRIVEYPLVMVIACLLRPRAGAERAAQAPASTPPGSKRHAGGKTNPPGRARAATSRPRSGSLGWVVFGGFMGLIFFVQSLGGDPRFLRLSERNFYGVHRVKFDPEHNLIGLLHGTTVHGIQSRDPKLRQEPMSYFRRSGPIGQVFAALQGPYFKRNIAVTGLGIGTLASYVGVGQELTYYEIDPTIERIATDTTYFTYLADCRSRGAKLEIVLGDARLQMTRFTGKYDLIILDAFSSDVAPVHLITREAIRIYLDRLEDDGVLAIHISSRYFRLAPVLAALAHDANLVCLFQNDQSLSPEDMRLGLASSQWVVMARRPENLSTLWYDRRWVKVAADPRTRVWTDDYSNVLSAILWGGEAEAHLRATPTDGFRR